MSDGRLQRFAGTIEALRKILINVVWIAVVLVVLAAVGKLLLDRAPFEQGEPRTTVEIAAPIPWELVDEEVVDAFGAARQAAYREATRRVAAWVSTLEIRARSGFLDWYFDYWNQQRLGLEALWFASVHTVLAEQPTAAERITETIQEEFARRVLRPQVAQMELENIVRDVMQTYVAALQVHLGEVPERHAIPQGDWERYLDDIAIMTESVEGDRSVPLSAKALYVGSAGGALALGTQAAVLASKIGGKVAAKSAGSAAVKMATKTGAKVAAKAGGKLLGPIIGIGIIAWDLWDHQQTVAENRPLLEQALSDYLVEMENQILEDPETGVMAPIRRIEAAMVESIRRD